MTDVFLPIERSSESGDFFVLVDGVNKTLNGQITIYKKSGNGYENLGSLSQKPADFKKKLETDTYYVKKEDINLLGGNKTKRRQYRYRSSSKKRFASRRRNVSRRRRGRQTRYSRRK